ncbi:MAG TPA: hypothetical protein VLN90_03225, partial [Thioalkalivibrio sp.]|nr:hypothetical protein [Thioalkalivibrio sp.]
AIYHEAHEVHEEKSKSAFSRKDAENAKKILLMDLYFLGAPCVFAREHLFFLRALRGLRG